MHIDGWLLSAATHSHSLTQVHHTHSHTYTTLTLTHSHTHTPCSHSHIHHTHTHSHSHHTHTHSHTYTATHTHAHSLAFRGRDVQWLPTRGEKWPHWNKILFILGHYRTRWDVAGRKVSVGRRCGLWGWNGGHVQDYNHENIFWGCNVKCTHVHVYMHTQIQYTHTPLHNHTNIHAHITRTPHIFHTLRHHTHLPHILTYHTQSPHTHTHTHTCTHQHTHAPHYTTHPPHTYRIARNFSRVKFFANWSLWTFLRFNFRGQNSPGKWSHTHKQAMCLHMRKHTLNVYGAKYFSKAISVLISLSLQLSVKMLCDSSSLSVHSNCVKAMRVKIWRF